MLQFKFDLMFDNNGHCLVDCDSDLLADHKVFILNEKEFQFEIGILKRVRHFNYYFNKSELAPEKEVVSWNKYARITWCKVNLSERNFEVIKRKIQEEGGHMTIVVECKELE